MPFSGHGVYLIPGKRVSEFGHPSVVVEKLAKLPVKVTREDKENLFCVIR